MAVRVGLGVNVGVLVGTCVSAVVGDGVLEGDSVGDADGCAFESKLGADVVGVAEGTRVRVAVGV